MNSRRNTYTGEYEIQCSECGCWFHPTSFSVKNGMTIAVCPHCTHLEVGERS